MVTIAVVLVGGAGASAVFLRGAAQRREDRAAILTYERAVVPIVNEPGRVVVEEMRPSLREFNDGELTGEQLLRRAAAWARVFGEARSQLLALDPPGFLGDIEVRWREALDGYLATVQGFETLARGAESQRPRLIADAAAAGERADDLFDKAAAVIQFHRRLLGLGASRDLPDPATTASPA